MSLTAVRYDKRTTNFNPDEEKFWLHWLSRDSKDHQVRDYIKSQIRHNPTLRRELLEQPVCEKCEGFTFFHHGGAQCVACGHWTPESQTHAVKIHLAGGHYR